MLKQTKQRNDMSINRTEDFLPKVDEFSVDSQIDERPTQSSSNAVLSGWDAAEKLTVSAGDYPTEFKFVDGEFTIVKFIDQNGPFAIYKQHFLQQKTVGKRSYVSLGANDPLCVKLGSKPEDKRAFTMAVVTPAGVVRQMLIASPRLYKTLYAAEFSPQGPLTKNYWAISRTGKMQQTVYHLNAVKSRDLMEDWGIDSDMAEKGVAEVKPFERSVIKEHTWAELEEIANSLL
jgi:hypothetical protein